jgi:hypothetical protein
MELTEHPLLVGLSAGSLAGLRMVCPVFECESTWLATGEIVNEYGVSQGSIIPLRACRKHPLISGQTSEIVEAPL